MQYQHIQIPADGEAISANRDHSLNVPNFPIVPFIEGDGIGVDVTPVMLDVVNAAVESELEQLIPGATLVGSKGFGDAVIRHMAN